MTRAAGRVRSLLLLATLATGCGEASPIDMWISMNPEAGAGFEAPVREASSDPDAPDAAGGSGGEGGAAGSGVAGSGGAGGDAGSGGTAGDDGSGGAAGAGGGGGDSAS
jgi:hypothetical protein